MRPQCGPRATRPDGIGSRNTRAVTNDRFVAAFFLWSPFGHEIPAPLRSMRYRTRGRSLAGGRESCMPMRSHAGSSLVARSSRTEAGHVRTRPARRCASGHGTSSAPDSGGRDAVACHRNGRRRLWWTDSFPDPGSRVAADRRLPSRCRDRCTQSRRRAPRVDGVSRPGFGILPGSFPVLRRTDSTLLHPVAARWSGCCGHRYPACRRRPLHAFQPRSLRRSSKATMTEWSEIAGTERVHLDAQATISLQDGHSCPSQSPCVVRQPEFHLRVSLSLATGMRIGGRR